MKKISSWSITAMLLAGLMALNIHIAVDQSEHGDSNTSFIQLTEVLAEGVDVGMMSDQLTCSSLANCPDFGQCNGPGVVSGCQIDCYGSDTEFQCTEPDDPIED